MNIPITSQLCALVEQMDQDMPASFDHHQRTATIRVKDKMMNLILRFTNNRFPNSNGAPAVQKEEVPTTVNPELDAIVESTLTHLEEKVSYTSLVLLQRLKCRLPSTRGLLAHRLFASAYMIASKNIYGDTTRSNMFWVNAFERRFTLEELDEMEQEMYMWLDGEVDVDDEILGKFRAAVEEDFCQEKKEYPEYSYSMVSRRLVEQNASEFTEFTSAATVPTPTFVIQRRPPCHEALLF